ncbi:hypothetical protein [Gluconacetobacter sacchari]|uniref:Uncharacterized protein n=2 Tax=Gluconacetobacter sacchari TaxID=92759 RepID=A0A7W4IBC7_9PROT|nr:hypothetical protein [Gluconacetobacter sacchari]MBB2159745.1 hypothetical protein [Gluconacetobacter sacchari]
MSDPMTPQPWWAAALGAGLFTIRWLIGFGGRSATATIRSQAKEIARLSSRIDDLEARQRDNEEQIADLRTENVQLRQKIHGVDTNDAARPPQ